MREYPKIQTVFRRDSATNYKTLLMGEYSLPEFEYLQDCEWEFTEKIDGTNIRVCWDGMIYVTFSGRTDKAMIPIFLLEKLRGLFTPEKMKVQFPDCEVTLYGEGYGARIQKGGGNYIPDGVSFVLFDVRIGDWWLKREDVEQIAAALKIDSVPVVGYGTLYDLIDLGKSEFKSQWGNFTAEGIVARPVVELKARNGSRIITKIKHKDFIKGKDK